ncbi:uncharacterized protein [Rutidosis leptorrhynchoides]|uniref:uncharacterized protein n=1 Tax=Rutidosis leptorrhynchoides TaxID=125765 RepID=UPI003A998BED
MTNICEPAEGCPSFFKVIRYRSSPYLFLPNAFVKKFSEKIPENSIFKAVAGDHCWKLKLVKIDDKYCFADGWVELVKDVKLGPKDMVVFWLVDPFTFQASFLDKHGCCKDLTFNKTNGDDNDDVADGHDNDDVADGHGNDDENGVDDVVHMQDKYLCFQKIIEKSHIYTMWLPTKFVKSAGLENETKIMMKDHEGKEWIMDIKIEVHGRKTKHRLSSGWSIFRDYHQLSEGDVCLFKFNKKEGVLNLTQVLKSKKAIAKEDLTEEGKTTKRGRPPSHGGGGGANVENENEPKVIKKKRGRPPLEKQIPGSVGVKIIDVTVPEVVEVQRKRGRPPLQKNGSGSRPVEAERKRGRPPLQKNGSGGHPVEAERKRGRPPLQKRGSGARSVEAKRRRGTPPLQKHGSCAPMEAKTKRGRPLLPLQKNGSGDCPMEVKEEFDRSNHIVYF